MTRPLLLALVVPALLSACTWVRMDSDAYGVRVAREAEDLSYCERRGEVAVTVRDRVAFYDRNEIRVRDELETLARNEAPRIHADTVQPIAEPFQGEQRFAAFACRGATRSATAPRQEAPTAQPLREEPVQTFPLRGD